MDHTHVSISSQAHLLLINPVVIGNFASFSSNGLAERGAIKKFSESSACRMRKYLRTCFVEYTSFITLTYPFTYPIDGKESKEHLRRFMQELKRYVGKKCGSNTESTLFKNFSAFWFLEFQQRGAIHYHIFVNEFIDKRWIANTWYRIVGSDDKRHLAAGTSVEKIRSGRAGTCSYASKYAAKAEQKEVPSFLANVGRFWGICGQRKCMSAATIVKAGDNNGSVVKKRLKQLKELILMLVLDGQAKLLPRNNRSHSVYYLKTDFAITSIVALVMRLEVDNAINGIMPTYDLPHHHYVKDQWGVE